LLPSSPSCLKRSSIFLDARKGKTKTQARVNLCIQINNSFHYHTLKFSMPGNLEGLYLSDQEL
jgi:hypothetical protein